MIRPGIKGRRTSKKKTLLLPLSRPARYHIHRHSNKQLPPRATIKPGKQSENKTPLDLFRTTPMFLGTKYLRLVWDRFCKIKKGEHSLAHSSYDERIQITCDASSRDGSVCFSRTKSGPATSHPHISLVLHEGLILSRPPAGGLRSAYCALGPYFTAKRAD